VTRAPWTRGAIAPTWRRADLLLLAIVLLAAVLRLSRLGSQSFWLDEAFSVALARAPRGSFWFEIRTREANMALYYGLLRLWLRGGSGEAFVRLLSAIAGIATVPVVYAIGARLFGRRTGLAGALLLAVDPMHVYDSQDARSYALAVLLVSLSTLAFVRALGTAAATPPSPVSAEHASPATRGRERTAGWWVLYAVTSALAVYAHFYAGLVLLAQWVSLLVRRGRLPWRRLSAAGATIAVLLAPLAGFLLSGPHSNIDWLGDAVRTTLPRLLRAGFSAPGFAIGAGYVSVLGGLVATGIAAIRSARLPEERWAFAVVLAWLVVPAGIALIVSVTDRPVLEPRYLSVCLPALALMAAAVIATAPAAWVRGLVLGVIVLAAGGTDWALLTRYRKENWRDATRLILTASRPGDVIVFYAPYVRRAFDYYRDRPGPSRSTPRVLYPSDQYSEFRFGGTSTVTLGRALDSAAAADGAVWLVLSHTASDTVCLRAMDSALRVTHPLLETRAFPALEVRRYEVGTPGAASVGAFHATAAGDRVAVRCPQR